MRLTVAEIMQELKVNNIGKVRTLLSLPQFEAKRTKMTGRSGRCFLYDLDETLLSELKKLYIERTCWAKVRIKT